MAQTNKEKIVSVPNVGVVAFPGDMEDEHVAAVIRAIRSQKAAEQAAQTHKLNRPMPLTTEESERRRQLKQAQPLSTAIPHLPAWLNTPSTELGRQASNWLSGEIGKAIGTTLPTFDPGALQREEAAQFQARHPIAGGVAHGISDIANGLTSPANMALLLTAPESKAMSALFALQALHGSYRDAQTAREAYREGNNEEATRYATESILGGAMGFAAGAHAVRPEVGPQGEVLPPEKRPAPEFPTLAAPMPVTLEGKIGGFGLPEYTESPIANYQIIYKSPGPKPEELNGAINDLVHARQSPGWNDPNASEHEARIAQQNFRDAANRLNRLQQMAVGQVRQLPSGEKVVYLTRDGLQDLAAGLRGGAPDPNYSLNGISIGPRYIPIITANLQHLQTPHAQELTKLLNLGTGPKGDVTVSAVPAKGETLSDALSRLREEINHGWQKTFTNAMGNHLPAPEYKDLNDAIPPAMSGYLYQNGYPENTGDREANRMRVLEASSKMMSSAPSEFGLTPDEVANYLFEYFDAVTREHGPEALDKLVHTTTLARNIKRDYANARYPSRGSQGQGTLSSLPAGGQGSPQAGAGAPGRGTAPVTGPPPQAGAAVPSLSATRSAMSQARNAPKAVTETPEFKRWFGDSEVVDENGQPLVMYHGSPKTFTEFKDMPKPAGHIASLGEGHYFTSDRQTAENFMHGKKAPSKTSKLYEVYISAKIPFSVATADANRLIDAIKKVRAEDGGEPLPQRVLDSYARDVEEIKADAAQNIPLHNEFTGLDKLVSLFPKRVLQEAGYDSIAFHGNGKTKPFNEMVVFDPKQVKSATENRGTFDPSSADVTMNQTRRDLPEWDGEGPIRSFPGYEHGGKFSRIRQIRPDLIDPTEKPEEGVVQRLMNALLYDDGEPIPAITVERDADGRYFILDGHNRYEAARRLGYHTIPVRVWTSPDDVHGDDDSPDITMNQVRATKETARPSVQALMDEALRRRPTQPTLSEVTKDIAARGASVVP